MLRMDGFTFQAATSPEEAVRLWHHHEGAAYIAGGTDILPNIKHRIASPRVLNSPAPFPRAGVSTGRGGDRCRHHAVRAGHLHLAAGGGNSSRAAGPPASKHGHAGRQRDARHALSVSEPDGPLATEPGHCLKAEGTWCHGRRPQTCVATQSSDTVPALMAHGARIRVLGPDGAQDIPLAELFRFDGIHNHTISKGHLITHVIVPVPPSDHRARYDKLRTRGAIDFPQLSVAIAGRMTGSGSSCVAHELTVVVGAINSAALAIRGVEAFAGRTLDDATVAALGALVHKRCRPQASVHGDPGWRRSMARITVERGLRALRG